LQRLSVFKKTFWIAVIQSLNLFITFKFSWGQDNSLELKPGKMKKKSLSVREMPQKEYGLQACFII